MLTSFIRAVRFLVVERCVPACLAGVLTLILCASPSQAQTFEPTLTVGAGIQGSFQHFDPDPNTGKDTLDQFSLGHLRLYFSGDITKNFSAMINTDYIYDPNSSSSNANTMQVLDAVGEFHTSPMFNIWFGRFLPPSDRANFHGPFYSNEWAVYQDGVEDGYPAIYQGRDDGIAYWGDFKAGIVKIKASAGVFDGKSVTGDTDVIWAGRVQLDFWDPEGGYYLNSTYYGDKNLLAIAGATQVQSGKTGSTADFLMERKVLNGGAFTIEAEYARYNGLGGYYGSTKSEGGFGLVSILFPKQIGFGKVEALGKFADTEFTMPTPSFRQKTTDVELGYIIKQFDARVFAFGENKTFTGAGAMKNDWEAGLGLQLQLSKQILGQK